MTADGKLVPITLFPKWAQDCLYGGGHQSNLYPSAFETDEPILLCAPTRAGKVFFVVLNYLFIEFNA